MTHKFQMSKLIHIPRNPCWKRSHIIVNHFQHVANEFTGHCFADKFLLWDFPVPVNVNDLQNLFCSLAQNVVRHLYLGVSVRNMRYEQNRTRLAERTFVGRTAFFNCYFNTSNCHWWLNRRWQQQQRWCWRQWWWWWQQSLLWCWLVGDYNHDTWWWLVIIMGCHLHPHHCVKTWHHSLHLLI